MSRRGTVFSSLCAVLLFGANIAGESQTMLPEGNGQEIVQSTCTQCHGLTRIVNSGYSHGEWANLVAMMVDVGAKLSPQQSATVVDYLAKNFPEKSQAASVALASEVHATIKEWLLPTPDSHPHDPLAMPDGSVWYTGQYADVLGHLDPASGKIKEYKLPAHSGPHGLAADSDGNIWYTANFAGYIGRLDPKTGKVSRYPLPDADARDPHTPVFDQDGILWFTVQGGNFVGRLDPKSGAIKLVRLPSPRSLPYGLLIGSNGIPYFAEFGANRIGRIDPHTLQIHEYVLPNTDARPRRIARTSDNIIWYTDYARGYLGRLDPATGNVMEFSSPGGGGSGPYGMAVVRDAVWYSESGVQPNTVVRFDPKTHRFQNWPIPSGGGTVRNMSPMRDGNLALACSGVNRVAIVYIR